MEAIPVRPAPLIVPSKVTRGLNSYVLRFLCDALSSDRTAFLLSFGLYCIGRVLGYQSSAILPDCREIVGTVWKAETGFSGQRMVRNNES